MEINKHTLRGLNIQKEEAIGTAVLEAIPLEQKKKPDALLAYTWPSRIETSISP